MHPSELSIAEFDYNLPDFRIAKHPLPQRDGSKLLLFKSGQISHDTFTNINHHLPSDTLLVFNNSKVVECRMHLQKPTGGIIEIFALEPADEGCDITTAMGTRGAISYKCLVGGAAKWKQGQQLYKKVPHAGGQLTIMADLEKKLADSFQLHLHWEPAHLSFVEVLHALGELPIPPYLQRETEPEDNERYQTVYAKAEGSVAAPTAGLHFTAEVFSMLELAGIKKTYTTLHVGAGTFLPVKSATMAGHAMHAEFFEVSISFLDEILDSGTIIPVGTTAMRTLESLYWMGVKALNNPDAALASLQVQQWDAYDHTALKLPEKNEAISALQNWMKAQHMPKLMAKTSILIAPGYTFKVCSGLITNFHQPRSTLLLLVSALIGNDWRKVYDYALANDFRFLSYGDSSLLLP